MRHFLAILLIFSCLSATQIEGDVYSADSLFPISGVVLKASGPASVQVVLEEGNYSLELPPGEYEISAYYYDGDYLKYYFREDVYVEGEQMRYDLVLFSPDDFEEVMEFVSYEIEETPEAGLVDEKTLQIIAGIILLLFFLFGFVLYYFIFNKSADEAVSGMKRLSRPSEPRGELDEEEKRILDILSKSEGMNTQKELRGIMKCTDTKMSLLVSSLEARGHIKRIKRGRENIVKLVKK